MFLQITWPMLSEETSLRNLDPLIFLFLMNADAFVE